MLSINSFNDSFLTFTLTNAIISILVVSEHTIVQRILDYLDRGTQKDLLFMHLALLGLEPLGVAPAFFKRLY